MLPEVYSKRLRLMEQLWTTAELSAKYDSCPRIERIDAHFRALWRDEASLVP
jgi:hypothetical protein